MAFGNHPSTSTKQSVIDPNYLPNPKIARYWGDFQSYAYSLGLTNDQMRFAQVFFTGANCMLSGKAGVGKSFTIKILFDFLRKQNISVGRTATTGIAALQVEGQTIHSWAGLGLADEHLEALIEKIQKKGKVKARMRAAEILFIDEVSMAKGDLLDKLSGVLKYYRGSTRAFGGLQIVCSADWLQLPPIFKTDEVQQLAFHSKAWAEANMQTVVLNKVVRQQEGSVLLKVLNDVRVGDTSSLHLLDSRIGATWSDTEIEPVRIFCKNVDVDSYNRERLAKLATQSKTYYARDTGAPHHTDAFNKNSAAPQVLDLKIGAQVMLTTNVSVQDGFVNGSVGVVKAFSPTGVTVKFTHGTIIVDHNEWSIKEQEVGLDGKIVYKTVATRRQIPLKVCYAITAHKSQGQTLDRAIIDMSEAFGTGIVYTALSRVRDLESLSLAGPIPHDKIRVNPECLRFYEEVEQKQKPTG